MVTIWSRQRLCAYRWISSELEYKHVSFERYKIWVTQKTNRNRMLFLSLLQSKIMISFTFIATQKFVHPIPFSKTVLINLSILWSWLDSEQFFVQETMISSETYCSQSLSGYISNKISKGSCNRSLRATGISLLLLNSPSVLYTMLCVLSCHV